MGAVMMKKYFGLLFLLILFSVGCSNDGGKAAYKDPDIASGISETLASISDVILEVNYSGQSSFAKSEKLNFKNSLVKHFKTKKSDQSIFFIQSLWASADGTLSCGYSGNYTVSQTGWGSTSFIMSRSFSSCINSDRFTIAGKSYLFWAYLSTVSPYIQIDSSAEIARNITRTDYDGSYVNIKGNGIKLGSNERVSHTISWSNVYGSLKAMGIEINETRDCYDGNGIYLRTLSIVSETDLIYSIDGVIRNLSSGTVNAKIVKADGDIIYIKITFENIGWNTSFSPINGKAVLKVTGDMEGNGDLTFTENNEPYIDLEVDGKDVSGTLDIPTIN